MNETGQIKDLKTQIAAAEARYQEKTLELDALRTQFNEYSVVMVDANGREKQIPVGQIIRALRPNEMSLCIQELDLSHERLVCS